MTKPTFLFHQTCDIHNIKIEGIAEIPGRDGKIWYSHITITPKNRVGDTFETGNCFYQKVEGGSPVRRLLALASPKENYLPPLKNIKRFQDERTGEKMIEAEDPIMASEIIIGEVYEETDEWIDVIVRSCGRRQGHWRFLKLD
jgi:hypothetical protein